MKISAYSYPIVIREQSGTILVTAPDWGIYVTVPDIKGVKSTTQLAAQIGFAHAKVVQKIIAQAKAKEMAKKPLPKPTTTKELFDFEVDKERRFSPKEAAKILGISKNTVRRHMDCGKIPHVKTPGGHRYISETQLDEILAQRSQQRGGPAGDFSCQPE